MSKSSLCIVICTFLLLFSSIANAVTWVKVNDQSSGVIPAENPFTITMDCTPGAELICGIAVDANNNGVFEPGIDQISITRLYVDGSWVDEDSRSGYFKITLDLNIGFAVDKKLLFIAADRGNSTVASCSGTFHFSPTVQGMRGRVTDSSGVPLADIPVGASSTHNVTQYVLDQGNESPVSVTRTDSAGNYTLYLPAAGGYSIWAKDSTSVTPSDTFAETVYVPANMFVNNTNFQLPYTEPARPPHQNLYTVSGTVRDQDGRTIPFALVQVGFGNAVYADLQGYYSLKVPPGTQDVDAELAGFIWNGEDKVEVNGNMTLDIWMHRAAYSVNGLIENSRDSTPMSRVEIDLSGRNSGQDTSDTSGPSGKYLCWVDADTYDIAVWTPETAAFVGNYTAVDINGNTRSDFQLQPLTGTLVGTVTDTSDNPLPWVTVHSKLQSEPWERAHSLTVADGTYTVAAINDVTYDFEFTKPGYRTETSEGVTFSQDQQKPANILMTFISNPPVLSGGKVTPAYGKTGTDFTFEVTYTDKDNNPPAYVRLLGIPGSPLNMVKADSSDNNYVDGVRYILTTKLPEGDYGYTFSAADNQGVDALFAFCERKQHLGPYVRQTWSPTNDSLTPNSGGLSSGTKYTFTSKYSDMDGVPNIATCALLLNTNPGSSANSVSLLYKASTNSMYLRNDAGTAWFGPFPLGSANVMENSQCKVYCAETTKSTSGNQLTINWRVELKPSLNDRTLLEWMYVTDTESKTDGWDKMGAVKVGQPPVNVSLSPNTGAMPSGATIAFAAKYSDPVGANYLTGCYLVLNTTAGVSANSVYLFYNVVENKLYLRNDAGTGWIGGYAPGSADIIENSQCKVYCSGSGPQATGTQLTMNWSVEFKPSQNGQTLLEWMYVSNRTGLADGWDKVGVIQISQPPVNVSLSPNSGSIAPGTKQSFICQYADPDGFGNIAYAFFILNKTWGVGSNSAYVVYNQKVNLLYLKNDANTGWLGGFTPGSNNTIENAQCKVYCAETTVSGTGNNLTVNWKIQPKSTMAGQTWMESLWVTDRANLSDGWDKFGNLTVQ